MMYVFVATLLILSVIRVDCDEKKYQQAELRARLAKARSIEDALIILKTSSKAGAKAMISRDSLQREQQAIAATARQWTGNARSITEPRNGGCEPRVICEEVPVDRSSGNNMVSFPQCVEVHRCGGCCQEAQFSCVATREQMVTFSPLLLISVDDTDRYEVNRPLSIKNHTQCECKCSKTEEQCHREGKALDSALCQCVQPRCAPECPISSTCSIVPGSDTPRCTCRRRIQGQPGNYCTSPNQRPNTMCTRCEPIYG